MDKELTKLVEKARNVVISPEDKAEQRLNYAYGNADEGNEGTMDAVKAAATIMRDAVGSR